MFRITTSEKDGAARKRHRRKILLPRIGESILIAVAVVCLAILIMQDVWSVVEFLYSPLAIILLVVVFAEFLILKGGDRSRLYRLEIERMREREQEQIERLRLAVDELQRAREACQSGLKTADPEATSDNGAAQQIEESLARMEGLLKPNLKE
jgi:uncharacterized membrane protein YcjF (UPF0283 family)